MIEQTGKSGFNYVTRLWEKSYIVEPENGQGIAIRQIYGDHTLGPEIVISETHLAQLQTITNTLGHTAIICAYINDKLDPDTTGRIMAVNDIRDSRQT